MPRVCVSDSRTRWWRDSAEARWPWWCSAAARLLMVQSMPGEFGLWLRDSRVVRTSRRSVVASEFLPCFVRAAPRLSFSARVVRRPWSSEEVFDGVG